MPFKFVQIASREMGEGAALIIGIFSFLFLISGGWWLLNWMAVHPRPILTTNDVKSVPFMHTLNKPVPDLPVVFRMSATTGITLIILLLIPPFLAVVMIISGWEGGPDFLLELAISLLNPFILTLVCLVFLLCPFTAWNIYWRRRDFIRFDINRVEYRSAYKTGTLVPASIQMFRSRSWRFDLTDLFRGQMASSWFLEIIPAPGHGQKNADGGVEHVVLDLKAMNLGGSARSIAGLLLQVYGDKFLINNQLPSSR